MIYLFNLIQQKQKMSSLEELEDSSDSKTFIDKLLVEMKSEFNKNIPKTEKNDYDNNGLSNEPPMLKIETDTTNFLLHTSDSNPPNITKIESEDTKTEHLDSPEIDEDETKPRIVIKIKPTLNNYSTDKDNSSEEAVSPGRRSLRIKTNLPEDKDKKIEMESGLKRSARRRSKDCTESILQSAIARKEKSYNETVRPQRLTRKLKPTAKILANLEMCQKNVSQKNEKSKQNDNKSRNSSAKSSPTMERIFYDKLDKCSEKAILEADTYIKQEEPPEYKKIKRKLKVKNVKSLMKKPKKNEDDSDSSVFSSPQETEAENVLMEQDEKMKNARKSETDGKSSRRSHRKTRYLLGLGLCVLWDNNELLIIICKKYKCSFIRSFLSLKNVE